MSFDSMIDIEEADPSGRISSSGLSYPWLRQLPSEETVAPAHSVPALLQPEEIVGTWLDRVAIIPGVRFQKAGSRNHDKKSSQIQVLLGIQKRWALSNREVAFLLGFGSDAEAARDVLKGSVIANDAGILERISNIFRIYEAVYSLLNDPEDERRWIREGVPSLSGFSCLDIMLRGRVEDLINARRWIEHIAGR